REVAGPRARQTRRPTRVRYGWSRRGAAGGDRDGENERQSVQRSHGADGVRISCPRRAPFSRASIVIRSHQTEPVRPHSVTKPAQWLRAARRALSSFLGSSIACQQVLKAGDQAPLFELGGTDGQMHSLERLRDSWVVLAWFPKAFTGG